MQIADVKAAGLYAVIAPQMGKQVVAFQVRFLPALGVTERINPSGQSKGRLGGA